MIANASTDLARQVADGLGIDIPAPQERVLETPATPEIDVSPALSMRARPGDGSVKTRHVALLVADGIDAVALRAVHAALADAGAVPRFVGAKLGKVTPSSGDPIHVEVTMSTAPAVLWDGLVVPAGDDALAAMGPAVEFIKDQYRHCKTILLLGEALAAKAMLPTSLPDGGADPGLLHGADAGAFIKALSQHRHYERETDPPAV